MITNVLPPFYGSQCDRFPLPVNTGRVDGRAFPLAELTVIESQDHVVLFLGLM